MDVCDDLAPFRGLFWSRWGEVLCFAYTKYSLIFLLFILGRGSEKGGGYGWNGGKGKAMSCFFKWGGGRFGGCVSFVFMMLLLSHKFNYLTLFWK